MQLLKLAQKNQKRAIESRFEKWKFAYMGNREGFQVISQMKKVHMQYSSGELINNKSQITNSRSALHDNKSTNNRGGIEATLSESKSFYTDFSATSLGQDRSGISTSVKNGPNGMQASQLVILTKCLYACFRYRSRKVANSFWKWKFQPPVLSGGRSTIHGATDRTALDADSEVADLIQKYKLFNPEEQ